MPLPLVLLPGLFCTEALWQETMTAAREYGILPLFMDFPACSRLNEVVDWVLSQAPERFTVAGFSFGSVVASEIAMQAPERVEKLALLSMNDGKISENVRKHFIELKRRILAGEYHQVLRELAAQYCHQDTRPEFKTWYFEMVKTVPADRALKQIDIMLSAELQGFENIACPTLIIGGANDERTTPMQQKQLAAWIPHSTRVEIPKAGHFSLYDQPALVNQTLFNWILK